MCAAVSHPVMSLSFLAMKTSLSPSCSFPLKPWCSLVVITLREDNLQLGTLPKPCFLWPPLSPLALLALLFPLCNRTEFPNSTTVCLKKCEAQSQISDFY